VLTYSIEQLPSFNAAFYNGARAELFKVAELTVPARDARAFEAPAGHFFRVVSTEDPVENQMAELLDHDPRGTD
jgi:hypothetical protein